MLYTLITSTTLKHDRHVHYSFINILFNIYFIIKSGVALMYPLYALYMWLTCEGYIRVTLS